MGAEIKKNDKRTEDSPFEELVNRILAGLIPGKFIWNGKKNLKSAEHYPVIVKSRNKYITINYTPDFILDFTAYDRIILLEPHKGADFDQRMINKLQAFRTIYFNRFYLVVITDSLKVFEEQLRKSKLERKNICDAVWLEPPNTDWKEFINKKLFGLIAHSTPIKMVEEGVVNKNKTTTEIISPKIDSVQKPVILQKPDIITSVSKIPQESAKKEDQFTLDLKNADTLFANRKYREARKIYISLMRQRRSGMENELFIKIAKTTGLIEPEVKGHSSEIEINKSMLDEFQKDTGLINRCKLLFMRFINFFKGR